MYLRIASLIAALVLASPAAEAKDNPAHAHNLMGEGIGLNGYDPVAYFPEGGGQPVKGSIQISAEHEGVVYRFASDAHRQLFKQSPGKYLPQYGGWCAAAAAYGKRVDVDPLAYELRDGRLYLFYREPQYDARTNWLAKAAQFIKDADAKWPALAR